MTYSTTLNQSNIEGNNNKFYIIQLLQEEREPFDLMLFMRWGRVGVPGQTDNNIYQNKADGIMNYHKKFRWNLCPTHN